MQPNIDFSKYGIILEERGNKMRLPKEITQEIIYKMQTATGQKTDRVFAEIIGVSSAALRKMKSDGTCRLNEQHIAKFFGRYPYISPDTIFNGHVHTSLGHLEHPPKHITPIAIPLHKRGDFLLDMGYILGMVNDASFIRTFPPYEQFYFLDTGKIPARWLEILDGKEGNYDLRIKYFSEMPSMPIIEHVPENYLRTNHR